MRTIAQTEQSNQLLSLAASATAPAQTNGKPARRTAPETQQLFFNRELSQLEFYRRVLAEALDQSQPLLERLKFLAILSTNLDEFFMIRVSGLKEAADLETASRSRDGLTAQEQLRAIRERVCELVQQQSRCLTAEVLPQLAASGVTIAHYDSLRENERAQLDQYFASQVFPILTPQAVDPGHPFPYVSGGSLNLGLMVSPKIGDPNGSDERFVRMKIPPVVSRLVPVEGKETKFVLLENLVAANAGLLFPNMHAGECHAFCITRDADIEVRDREADDLLRAVQQILRKRRFGSPVRLEVAATMPPAMVLYLSEAAGLESDDVYEVEGSLRLPDLMSLLQIDRPDLKDRPMPVTTPDEFQQPARIFDVIRERDFLLHHPYASYHTVVDFISAAADDPDVLAIKICLYRTGADSPIPPALIRASERGKQVTVLIELKARFDEANNIEWAQKLERAGVHVVYGMIGLKTHCKLTLVVRREGDELRRYVHLATGNYNPTTSCVYTDLGLFTCDEAVGQDATDLFNYLTGYSRQDRFRKLLVSPVNLRETMAGLIRRETEHAREGRPAQIIAKLNRLADDEMIRLLYDASQAGVKIDLIVRGICLLRPGVAGLSENIRVRSIVGRYLEHSRVYYFANGGNEEIYLGSADLMERNLNRRVEVVAPVRDVQQLRYLKEVLLANYLRDSTNAWELRPDGTYQKNVAEGRSFRSQESFAGKASFCPGDSITQTPVVRP